MSANATYVPDNTLTPVHVVLAVYDPKGTYSQHAGVVMTSIFENTQSPVGVHILHDETLTEDSSEAEGDVNLMEIVGPEALSSMVEALTETGNEEGLQVIGQIMGGPGGDGGEAPSGLDGIESPGVGGGPGSMGDNGFGSDGPGGFSSDGPGL